MQLLQISFTFIFGVILGSFGNVLIARYQTGIGIGGRSRCLTCSKTLGVSDLIPVVSYLWRGGKCAYCGALISIQYPIVEMLAGLYAVLIYLAAASLEELLILLIALLPLLVIAVYDYRHYIIPPLYANALFLVALASLLIQPTFLFATLTAAFGAMLFFYSLWLFSDGMAMGFGDVGLVLSLSILFGYPISIVGVLFAFWLGAAVGIVLLFQRGRGHTLKSEVPFGPFLIAGFVLAFALVRLYPAVLYLFV